MQGNELHAKVWDKRRQIIEEIEYLLRQLKACDDTLASLPPTPAEPPPAPAPAAPAAATPPAAAVAPAPAPPPATPTVPPIAPELLAPYSAPGVHQRGSLAVRVEQAVADCGPTFTVAQVVAAFRARYQTKGKPTRKHIAGTLWRIAHQRGYKILRHGTGRTATLYAK